MASGPSGIEFGVKGKNRMKELRLGVRGHDAERCAPVRSPSRSIWMQDLELGMAVPPHEMWGNFQHLRCCEFEISLG